MPVCASEGKLNLEVQRLIRRLNSRTLYTSWRIYQEEMEKLAKNRLAQFEQLASITDAVKALRTHKQHIAKKCLDNHLK